MPGPSSSSAWTTTLFPWLPARQWLKPAVQRLASPAGDEAVLPRVGPGSPWTLAGSHHRQAGTPRGALPHARAFSSTRTARIRSPKSSSTRSRGSTVGSTRSPSSGRSPASRRSASTASTPRASPPPTRASRSGQRRQQHGGGRVGGGGVELVGLLVAAAGVALLGPAAGLGLALHVGAADLGPLQGRSAEEADGPAAAADQQRADGPGRRRLGDQGGERVVVDGQRRSGARTGPGPVGRVEGHAARVRPELGRAVPARRMPATQPASRSAGDGHRPVGRSGSSMSGTGVLGWQGTEGQPAGSGRTRERAVPYGRRPEDKSGTRGFGVGCGLAGRSAGRKHTPRSGRTASWPPPHLSVRHAFLGPPPLRVHQK